ncbi:hypothetical protein AgCh_017929 [Apium graveolens]
MIENIDLIQIAATELELKEKWKNIDEKIGNNFGQITKPDKLVKHFTQLRPILINEMSLRNLEKGQPSARRLLLANVILQPKKNYPKNPSKIPLDLVYETSKPDEEKLLGRSITYHKDARDSVLKKRNTKIYRHGKLIRVMAGHPQFVEAKKEEKSKEEAGFDEEKEEYMPTQSTTTSRPTLPTMEQAEFKVYSDINFHGKPIFPEDEPIDWESQPIPDLNIPIPTKPKKTKKRVVKQAKPIRIQSKALAKPKPTINKGETIMSLLLTKPVST